jgi:hypothetical protein
VLSIDTNILFAAVEVSNASHEAAVAFLEGADARDDIALSELALLELYILLRNPAVLVRPLDAPKAAAVCQAFRAHPRWQVLGLPNESRASTTLFGRDWRRRSSRVGAPSTGEWRCRCSNKAWMSLPRSTRTTS